MKSRIYTVAMGLLLMVAQPALADEEDTMVWDLNIASAVHQAMIRDEACQHNPHGLYRRGCGEPDPGLDFDDDAGPRVTVLDRLALFVYKYKDLNLDADIRPNTKFKLTMSLANLYEQEAKARVELRIRW